MPETPDDAIHHALKKNDPRPLTALDLQELEKLKLAEEILEARFHAQKRASKIAVVSSALVGYVALAGFFANAYQNYLNKVHLQQQQEQQDLKWKQEFDRGQRADKYKAFFEVSNLVTDQNNPERRLIGYGLMDEFVADPDYHARAVGILESSLERELRESASEPPADGLSEPHEVAISSIIKAMSASTSCHEFERVAKTIRGIVAHAAKADLAETRELFTLYTRRLVGRAAIVCRDFKDYDAVRAPVRTALRHVPDVAGLAKNATDAEVNGAITHLLVEACEIEERDLGSPECEEIRKKYTLFCQDAHAKADLWKLAEKSCIEVSSWKDMPVVPVAPPPAAAAE
jgi:hypothetical protein